jgi:hypothetical protein
LSTNKGKKLGLLIDTGACDNLDGVDSAWFKEHMAELTKRGIKPTIRGIPEMAVSGVGAGSAKATQAVIFPGVAVDSEGVAQPLMFNTPVVEGSSIPPLWGLRSLREQRALIDCAGLKLHLLGQGDLRLTLPPGSQTFPLELSDGGHLILPIGEFDALNRQNTSAATSSKKTLTFAAQIEEMSPTGASSTRAMMVDQGTQPSDDTDVDWRRKHIGFRPQSSK